VSIPEMLYGVQLGLRNDILFEQNQRILAGIERVEGREEETRKYVHREFTKLFNSEQSKEDTYCPNLFILRGSTREGHLTGLLEPIRSPGMLEKVREKTWKQRMELQLYCQAPGFWHPLGYERGKDDPKTGLYLIDVSSELLKDLGPLMVNMIKVMKYAQPILGPFVSWAEPEKYEKQFKLDVERFKSLTEGLTKSLPYIEDSHEAKLSSSLGELGDHYAAGATLRALRLLLKEKDKQQTWGGLQRIMTKEGHWLWLCPYHLKEYKN